MRRLNLTGQERVDVAHFRQAFENIEHLARRQGLSSYAGAGVLSGFAWSYNAGSRVFTFQPGLAIDADGNLVELSVATNASAVALADVGAANLYVWAAVRPGVTEADIRNRVFWEDVGVEETSPTYTAKEDAVTMQVAALQPPDTASGTKFFRVLAIVWNGSSPHATQTRRWWAIPMLRGGVAEGFFTNRNEFDASFTWEGRAGALARCVDLLLHCVSALAGPSIEPHGILSGLFEISNEQLNTRLTGVETRLDAHSPTYQGVPLAAWVPQAGASWTYPNARWEAQEAGTIECELTWHGWLRARHVYVRVQSGSGLTLTLTLRRYNKINNTNEVLDTATVSAGGTLETVLLEFGTGAQDLGEEGSRYIIIVAATGTTSASTRAIIYSTTLSLEEA